MSRRTKKYIKALEINSSFSHQTSDELYQKLTDDGYWWDSNCQSWIYSPASEQQPPSMTIKVRVWTDKARVKQVAEKIVELMEDEGHRCIDKSDVYPCRPPQANDARVYLTFE